MRTSPEEDRGWLRTDASNRDPDPATALSTPIVEVNPRAEAASSATHGPVVLVSVLLVAAIACGWMWPGVGRSLVVLLLAPFVVLGIRRWWVWRRYANTTYGRLAKLYNVLATLFTCGAIVSAGVRSPTTWDGVLLLAILATAGLAFHSSAHGHRVLGDLPTSLPNWLAGWIGRDRGARSIVSDESNHQHSRLLYLMVLLLTLVVLGLVLSLVFRSSDPGPPNKPDNEILDVEITDVAEVDEANDDDVDADDPTTAADDSGGRDEGATTSEPTVSSRPTTTVRVDCPPSWIALLRPASPEAPAPPFEAVASTYSRGGGPRSLGCGTNEWERAGAALVMRLTPAVENGPQGLLVAFGARVLPVQEPFAPALEALLATRNIVDAEYLNDGIGDHWLLHVEGRGCHVLHRSQYDSTVVEIPPAAWTAIETLVLTGENLPIVVATDYGFRVTTRSPSGAPFDDEFRIKIYSDHDGEADGYDYTGEVCTPARLSSAALVDAEQNPVAGRDP